MRKGGLVQVYTGSGKGKTTAAFGLALRAAGAGRGVLIYQFLKPESLESGERKALKQCSLPITIKCLDIEWDMTKSLKDFRAVAETQNKIAQLCEQIVSAAKNGTNEVIILDEMVFCLSKGLVGIESIKNIVEQKADNVEIVMTGRGATAELIALADLVTEMKAIKHPFDKGVMAREGIEY
ncbi:MAG: cob(I)yrinic acid a,c-diamide adenosyltransferase [Planctomycetes bacterium]|nr:cob(I)yrinic acid a,c-diamide adenosyltransferase [Planctomycetota bacterium]